MNGDIHLDYKGFDARIINKEDAKDAELEVIYSRLFEGKWTTEVATISLNQLENFIEVLELMKKLYHDR